MFATLTDDADRMPYGCDTFDADPYSDYDPMYSDDGIGDGPDHECKPYGWGIESFEDPALTEANVYAGGLVRLAGSMYRSPGGWSETMDARMADRNARWAANSKHNTRLERASDRAWDRICDESATHAEAVAKYTRWADRVTRKTN
jgi:hypothetical protein